MSDEKFVEWAKKEFESYSYQEINLECNHSFTTGYGGMLVCRHCGVDVDFIIKIDEAKKVWNACKEAYGVGDDDRDNK